MPDPEPNSSIVLFLTSIQLYFIKSVQYLLALNKICDHNECFLASLILISLYDSYLYSIGEEDDDSIPKSS